MSGFSQISLNQRLQGNNKFLELQTVNEDHFTLNSNAELSLANNLSLSGNLTMGGNLVIDGALSLGTGTNLSAEELTATTKLVTDKIQFSDNQTEGLIIEASDGADYIVCKSTDGSEQIQLKKSTFTDGNSVILGTNGSRGILQYGNIKNSTIDNTNTITANASSASQLQTARLIGGVSFNGTANIDLAGVNTAGNQNTTGTSGGWTTSRTTTFSGEDDENIGSVSIDGTGDTSATLAVAYHDQTNSVAHKLMLTNAITGHNSNGLQEQIRFKNEFMSGMNQSDNLVANWVQQKDITTFRIYDITASNTFQETSFARDSTGSHPKMNGFLEWNTDTSTGGFLSLSRDSSTYDSGSDRELPTGIKLLNLGEYNGSNLGGEMGGIKSNFVSEEFANTKIYAKYVSGSVGEASLTIKKDIFVMANSSALEFGSSDRRIVYNNAECAFTGSDDLFTFDYKMNVGKGKDDGNPATFGIEHINNIALGGADQEILSLKYTEGNTPTTHNYSFNGKSGGGISFSRQQYATSQDAYSGTKTVTDILTMNSTQTTLYKPLSSSDSALNIRPEGDQFNLSLGHYNDATDFWSHSINSAIDYNIQSTSGGGHFTVATNSGSLRLTSGGDVGIGTTNPDERLHIYGSGTDARLKIESPDDNPVINLLAGTKNIYMFNDDSTGDFTIRNSANGTQDLHWTNDGTLIATNTRLHYTNHPSYGSFSHKDTTGAGNYALLHDANGTLFINSASSRHIYFRNNNAGTMIVTDTGRLGINTTVPSQKLHVVGNIYATGSITSSDRRIKTDITPINDGTALNKINQLESYEYNYIDPERKKSQKTIGFIAQEVKEVIPNAVTILDDVIPDELRIIENPIWEDIEDESGNMLKYILEIPDLDISGSNYTGNIRLLCNNEEDEKKPIDVECVKDLSGNFTNRFKLEQKWDNVFLYGKGVDDFHTIDKSQIFALHHSAIQQLSREHDEYVIEAETKIANLEKMIIDLTKRVALNENALKTLL